MSLLERYRQRRVRAQEVRATQQEAMEHNEARRLRQELERQNAELKRARQGQMKAQVGGAIKRGFGMLSEMKQSMSTPQNPRRPKIAQLNMEPRIKQTPTGMRRPKQ